MPRFSSRFGLTRYEADEYYHLALQAYARKNVEEAIQQMNQAVALLPSLAEYYAARGFFFLEHGAPAEAQRDFDEALRRRPYEMLANYGKGRMAYEGKEWAEALQHFLAAWASQPERPETMYYIALVLHHQGDNVRALEWMEKAQAIFVKVSDQAHARQAERWVEELNKILKRSP